MATLVLSRKVLVETDLCTVSWCQRSEVIVCLNWALEFSPPPPLEVEA